MRFRRAAAAGDTMGTTPAEVFPRYAEYRAKTSRDIPVVRLRRR
ncbi:hypothetical protein AB0D13_36040 [Streptomyces sp. NPDC048430]